VAIPKGVLLIGDEIAHNLHPWLVSRAESMPERARLWGAGLPGMAIMYWAQSNSLEAWLEDLAELQRKQNAPLVPPDTIAVSLGRAEILTEPADIKPKELEELAENVNALIDKIEKAGATPLWILPPALPKEGKARATISEVLAKRGVRVLHLETRFTDSKASRTKPTEAQLGVEDFYKPAATVLSTWIPLGKPSLSPVLRPRRPVTGPAPSSLEEVWTAPSTLVTKAAGLSTGAKVGIGFALLAIVGGGVAIAARR